MLLSRTYNNPNRNRTLDIAKGIAILLMIYFHALQTGMMPIILLDTDTTRVDFSAWRFVYSFHMPFFFLASGITYRRHSTEYVLREGARLFLIAQISGLVGLVLKYFVLYPHHVQITLEKDIFQPFLLNFNFSIIVTWFLIALAIIRIAYHFFEAGDIIRKLLIVYALVSAFTLSKLFSIYPFQAGAVLPGFVFFLIGHRFSKYFLANDYLNKSNAVIFLGACLLITYFSDSINHGCLLSLTDHCNHFKNGFAVLMIYGKTGFVPLFFIAALSGCFSLILAANISQLFSETLSKTLSLLGTYSLELLIINGFFLKIIQLYIKAALHFETLEPSLTFFVAAILTITQVSLFYIVLKIRERHLV